MLVDEVKTNTRDFDVVVSWHDQFRGDARRIGSNDIPRSAFTEAVKSVVEESVKLCGLIPASAGLNSVKYSRDSSKRRYAVTISYLTERGQHVKAMLPKIEYLEGVEGDLIIPEGMDELTRSVRILADEAARYAKGERSQPELFEEEPQVAVN